jgi:hypothetical protein
MPTSILGKFSEHEIPGGIKNNTEDGGQARDSPHRLTNLKFMA